MLRRLRFILFSGVVLAMVLATGVVAGAAPRDVQDKEAEVGSAQERLESIRMESGAAYETYNSALFQLNELDARIGATEDDLASAEERMSEAQASLEERASQVYRSGNVGFMDVLVRADSFAEFSSRMNIWLRLLGEEQERFAEMREAAEAVETQKTALENQRFERVSALEEAGAQRDRASDTEAEAQAYLDSLSGELQAAIEEDEARKAEEARLAAEQAADAEPANIEPAEVAQVEEGSSAEEMAAEREAALAAQQRAEELAAQRQAAEDAAAEAERQAELAAEQEAEDAERRQAEAEAAREAAEQAAIEQEAAERAAAEQAAAEQAAAARQVAAEQEAADQAAADQAAADQAAVDRTAANQAANQAAAEEAAAAEEQAAANQAAAEQAAAEEEAAAAEQSALDQAAADQAAAEQAAADQAAADQAAMAPVEDMGGETATQPGSAQNGGGNMGGATGGNTTAPAAGGGGSANGGGIVGAAQAQLGVPYVYGGADPSGFDCSGLIMYVFAQFGVSLPHNAQAQYGYGSEGSGAAGDLVFWSADGSGGITHNGIATGNGTVIHAPYPGTVVREEGIWQDGLVGYKTVA